MAQPTYREPNGLTHLSEEEWGPLDEALGVIQHLQERVAELEIDELGWERLSWEGQRDFSRDGLQKIADRARLFYLKNPIINRGVNVQALYVYGQGLNIAAPDDRVGKLIERFIDDPGNQRVFTSHQARGDLEKLLAVGGNVFFALFTSPSSGRVQVRSMLMSEMRDLICNPEDASEPWFWIREWADPAAPGQTRARAYPDFRHWPAQLPPAVMWQGKQVPVADDTRIYHIKVGSLADMRWGLSEVYQALDWAFAYKGFLEDAATLFKALSKIAWRMTVKGKAAEVAAARAKLSRQPASSSEPQTNRQIAGMTAISGDGNLMEAMPKTGASISPEDGRRIALMAFAAMGLPETFFGDVSVGTLATATSLDRPTELKFRDRQQLWVDVHEDLLSYVIDRAIEAPNGGLPGAWVPEEGADSFEAYPNGRGRWVLDPDPDAITPAGEEPPEEGDRSVEVGFPSILEHDVGASVEAIVKAVTLGGSPLQDALITPQQASAALLEALGFDNIDEMLEDIFPVDDQGNPKLRDDQERREELQAKQDQLKLKLAGRMPEEGANGGPPGRDGLGSLPAESREAVGELARQILLYAGDYAERYRLAETAGTGAGEGSASSG